MRTAEEVARFTWDSYIDYGEWPGYCSAVSADLVEWRRKILTEAANRAEWERNRWAVGSAEYHKDDLRRAVMGEEV